MSTTLLFMGFGMQELVVIVLIFLLLFGGKKIPELMKGLGKGVKNFKDGVNGIEEDRRRLEDRHEERRKQSSER